MGLRGFDGRRGREGCARFNPKAIAGETNTCSTRPERGCAWVASRASFCRDLQRREPQNPEEMEGRAYESLTVHHFISQVVTPHVLRVAAPRRVLPRLWRQIPIERLGAGLVLGAVQMRVRIHGCVVHYKAGLLFGALVNQT